jgi:hypothetical protein
VVLNEGKNDWNYWQKTGMTQLYDDGRFTGVSVIDFSGCA